MKITDVPFAVLRFQYQLVRYPLQLIEDRVMTRLQSEAPGRLLYERSFGTLDATVGSVLGDSELARRGSALAERSDALGRAARLDGAAAKTERHADEKLAAERDQAVQEQQEARKSSQREAAEARRAADERKRAAVDEARTQAADAKNQADEVAARRASSIETDKRKQEATIRAVERGAEKAADAKLGDAQEKRGKAASTRARADRVEELADVEKQKRQTERANDA